MTAPAIAVPRLAGALYLLQIASTLALTGLIWFVQIVHYPLFAEVGDRAFVRYELLHAQRTGWVVFIPMLLELGSSLAALVPALRAPALSRVQAITLAILVTVIWLSTALVQVPLHNALSRAPTPALMHQLVLSNWVRTLAWTARSAILLASLYGAHAFA